MAVRLVILLALVVALPTCVQSPQVVEGTVVSLDRNANTMTVRDSRAPEAVVQLSLAGTDIDARPEVGDSVRAAYVDRDGVATAIRVMNMSKQEEQTGARH